MVIVGSVLAKGKGASNPNMESETLSVLPEANVEIA